MGAIAKKHGVDWQNPDELASGQYEEIDQLQQQEDSVVEEIDEDIPGTFVPTLSVVISVLIYILGFFLFSKNQDVH